MIHVITYGDDRFLKSRERAVKSIENFVDSTKIYTDKDLEKLIDLIKTDPKMKKEIINKLLNM